MNDPDPHDADDEAEIIIKPLMFTGTILLSAGAGLAAGLLICWLFGCNVEDSDDSRTGVTAIDSSYTSSSPNRPSVE